MVHFSDRQSDSESVTRSTVGEKLKDGLFYIKSLGYRRNQ